MKWKGIKRRLRGSSSSSGNHIRDDVTLSLTAVNVEVEDDDSVENKNTGEYKNASYCQMLRYAELTDYLLLLFGLLFSVLDGICAPFGSMIFKGISDVLMSGQAAYLSGNFNFDEFAREIMYYCLLYFLQGLNMFILTILAMGCFSTLSERVAYQIKKHYFEAVLMQDQQWFDDHNVGSLTQIITSGIDKIRHGTSDKLVLVIKSTANVISGVVFAFYLSPELTIVMLIMSPFLVSSMYLSNKMLAVQTRKEMAAYSECGAVAEEVLYAIKTVISFNGQLFEIKRYSQSLERAKTVGFRKALIVSACLAVYCAINFFSMGVGFYYGTRLVFDHKISPGVVFGVFWCIFIGCLRFGMAVPQFATLIKAKAAAGEIFAIIDIQPTIDRSAGLTPKAVEGRLEFKNVEFSYPKRRNVKVLKGVSFSVEAGQNVALVGHSGCGKSTMIGLLMRYYQQERGSITVDGVPVQELNVEWLRSNIGIVSQEPVLFQNTVLENLQMGQSTASRGDVEEACTIANAHEFIMKLQDGYDTRIGDGGIKLSGGQKQRIAIARALLKKPKILLLDEATSALDTESERIVQEALDKASQNRTTVTVAHRLSTVKNADKIIVFDQGAIIESGTHEELFNDVNSHYRQLVLAQQVAGLEESEETDVPSSPKVATSRSRKVSKTDSVRTHESETEEEAEVNEMEELLKKEGVAAATPCEILSYAKNERKLFVTGLFFALIRGCSWPVFAVLYGMFFNLMADPTHSTAERSLYVATIGFGVLGVVSGFATWLSGYITGLVGEKLNVRLRMDVYKNLMRQDCSYFDDLKHSVGKLTARLATDSNNVQAAMDQRLADVLQGLTSFFAGLGVALYFGVQLAPFCLVASGVFIFIQYRISKSVKRRALQDTRIEEDEATMSSEAISNVKTIQSLTQERRICDKFFKVSEAPYKRAIARGWLMSVTLALGAAFVSLNFSVSYMVGLLTIKLGYCTPFTVFQVIESLNVATMMVMATVSYFPEYTRAKLSAGLIFHMLKQHPEIDNLSVEGTKPEIKGNVELKNVVFSYPNGRHVSTLDDISLKAQFGQTVALVGHSGCGKSTVIQLMERFYDVLGGSVKVDGTDVRGINIRHLRDSIALVGQEPTLFNLTIQDNISYGLENVSFQAIREAAKLANIDKFVDSLPQGYETMVGGRGSQLSGGQKQRIAIARAMIRKPKILLLDEATAALDSESEKLVQEALDKAKSGRTCIVVAHRLSTIQNSNVIYVLQNGKCVESGDHQKLLEKAGLYSNLVKSQNMS